MPKTTGSFKKGDGRRRRPKGALNKTTKESHELFMYIMNRQVGRVEAALDKINQDDPEKYLNALSKLFQYYIPRKTDVTSDNERIQINLPSIIIK